MSEYHPDNWVIVKFESTDATFYKVLAGWHGGFAYGDSWRMNSGISKVEENDGVYSFFGSSGSVYVCHKNSERFSMMTSEIFQNLIERGKEQGINISSINVTEIEEQYLL